MLDIYYYPPATLKDREWIDEDGKKYQVRFDLQVSFIVYAISMSYRECESKTSPGRKIVGVCMLYCFKVVQKDSKVPSESK